MPYSFYHMAPLGSFLGFNILRCLPSYKLYDCLIITTIVSHDEAKAHYVFAHFHNVLWLHQTFLHTYSSVRHSP